MTTNTVEEKFNRKTFLQNLKQKVDGFLKNRKFANNVVDIMESMKDDRCAIPCIHAISRVFSTLLTRGDMVYGKFHVEGVKDEENNVEIQYRLWITDRYKEATKKLLDFLHHPNMKVCQLSLTTLMKFVALEGKYPFRRDSNGRVFYFPTHRLWAIHDHLLSVDRDMRSVLQHYFQEYSSYADVGVHSWEVVPVILKAKSEQGKNSKDVLLGNLVALLKQVLPVTLDRDENKDKMKLLCLRDGQSLEETGFTVNKKRIGKHVAQIWDVIKTWKLSLTGHRHLVALVVDHIMMNLEEPLQLTDFLIDTFHMGGAVSLIALKGIFFLMDKHNLEYPEFYPKLYSMLNLDILHMKYKARFFYLLDLFLTSTHLPEYLVAAFAKRLARLSLAAPANCQMLMMAFIGNLLIRHSGLKVLIDRSSAVSDEVVDPYVEDEKDPAKCRALESSLWEIESLKCHILPKVSSAAGEVKLPLPKVEWDVSMMLETTYADVFEAEMKKFHKNIPTNHKRPASLALPDEADRFSKYWKIL